MCHFQVVWRDSQGGALRSNHNAKGERSYSHFCFRRVAEDCKSRPRKAPSSSSGQLLGRAAEARHAEAGQLLGKASVKVRHATVRECQRTDDPHVGGDYRFHMADELGFRAVLPGSVHSCFDFWYVYSLHQPTPILTGRGIGGHGIDIGLDDLDHVSYFAGERARSFLFWGNGGVKNLASVIRTLTP